MKKLGRNDPCWCGSGKKFKKCHWPHMDNDAVAREQVYKDFGAFGTDPLEQTLRQPMPYKNPQQILLKIQKEKANGTRPLPSATLISAGDLPAQADRIFLVDTCAQLVDRNWAGRSEMCIYFAVLIRHGLNLLGYEATVEIGKARYLGADESIELDHAWVVTGFGDIVDANVDSLIENPFVPENIKPKPYWGSGNTLPGRELRKVRDLPPERDEVEMDSEEISQWKQELETQIEEHQCGS